ncbi:hypothetical protein FKR81_38130 [Lentzea tibetensis]|uniref:Beta-lactamase class A n=1 Tax=Lentzea tibetensis TaxID=2591470 RepID=A0A563EHT0_9PSEU|nr:hypothetical protein [Lentzea tibetensis]TWP45795.1 hypothetical protein FKR81_38130 [Lentzea tibetensis]
MSWKGRFGLVAGLLAVALATTTAFPQETVCEARAKPRPAPVVAVPAPQLPESSAPAIPAPDLAGALASAVDAAGGKLDLGLAVLDLRTGTLVDSYGDQPFYSASLSKLILAVDMLQGPQSDDDLSLLTRALSASDDTAMDALWTSHDGMDAVSRVASLAGLTGTHAPDDPSQWGEVVVTANDVTRLYQYVLASTGLRDFIVPALSAAPEIAADGFDQEFGLLGTGAVTKQGWMYYLPSDVYLHSAGVVDDRYAVALLSVDQSGSWQAARSRVNAVTSALLAALRSPGQ